MNSMVGIGLVLIVLTVLFGWVGGGICILAGLMIGIVLIAVGLISSEEKSQPPLRVHDRYCPSCGRAIPFDADICPYCGEKFDNA